MTPAKDKTKQDAPDQFTITETADDARQGQSAYESSDSKI